MRKLHHLLGLVALLGLLVMLPGNSHAQQSNNNNKIEKAFSTGDAHAIAKYFGMTVDLKILEKENTYGNSQAEVLLEGFFRSNPPSKFLVIHRNNRAGNSFIIGKMSSGKNTYRVNIFTKQEDSKTTITQIQIVNSQ